MVKNGGRELYEGGKYFSNVSYLYDFSKYLTDQVDTRNAQ
jgi:hypothetical protein